MGGATETYREIDPLRPQIQQTRIGDHLNVNTWMIVDVLLPPMLFGFLGTTAVTALNAGGATKPESHA